MSYSLNVEPRSTYLFISVTGEISVDTVSSYLAEVIEWCQQLKCPNALIVEDLSGPSLRTARIYQLISRLSAQAAKVIGRLAYVDINHAHDQVGLKFAEDVAVNRGVLVQVFTTVKEAEAWLESEE